MKKLFLNMLLLCSVGIVSRAQSVGINTNSPDGSAALDVSSTSKGLLMPRLTTAQMAAIVNPATGLAVYNTDSSTICVYMGSDWRKIVLGNVTTTETDPKVGTLSNHYHPKWSGSSLTNSSVYDSANRISIGTVNPNFGSIFNFNKFTLASNSGDSSDFNNILAENTVLAPWMNWGKARGTLTAPLSVQNSDQLFTLGMSGYDSSTYKLAAQIQAHVDGAPSIGKVPSRIGFYTTSVGSSSISERLRITNAGRIGIGTTSPQSILSNTSSNILGTNGQGTNSNSITWAMNATGFVGAFYNSSTAANAQGLAVKTAATAGTNRLLDLSTGAQATAGSTVMVVQADGKVGIGNSSPTHKLEVSGTAKADTVQGAVLTMTTGANNGYVLQSDASGHASWANPTTLANGNWTTSGANQYSALGGNVGIGTTSPGGKLHVKGLGNLGTAVFEGSEIYSHFNYGADGSEDTYIRGGKSTSRVVINDAATGDIVLGAASSKIGVGKAMPAYRLDVNGTANADTLQGANLKITTGAANGYVLRTDGSGNASWANPQSMNGGGWAINGGNHYSVMDGNVGIGTSAPASKLSVTSNNAYAAQFDGSNTLGTWFGLNNNTAGATNWNLISGGAGLEPGKLMFRDNSNIRMTIQSSDGNVGIGTTSPTEKLEVNGKTKTTSFQMSNGAANGYVLQSDASGNGSWVNATSLPNSNWTTSGTSQYSALSGNVGIGTTSPTAKLHVVGNGLVDGGRLLFRNTGNAVFVGDSTGYADDYSANNSIFIGYRAGRSHVNGVDNIAIGANALDAATASNYNIAIGENVLGASGMSGNTNVAVGNFAMISNTTGNSNNAFGQDALGKNTTGNNNTGIGSNALDENTTGRNNTALGVEASPTATTGESNVSVGYFAANGLLGGSENVFVGASTASNSGGSSNTIIGSQAGSYLMGSGNVMIGFQAGNNEAGSNKLIITNDGFVTPLVYGDFAAKKFTINDSLESKYFKMTNGAVNGYVLASNASGQASWINPTTLANGNWTTSGTNQYSALGGNVGIGTASPTSKLHVSGNTTLDGTVNFSSNWNVQTGSDFWLEKSGTRYLTIYGSGGNVGIGTAAPGHKLDIQGSGATAANVQSSGGSANVNAAAPSGQEASLLFKTYSSGSSSNRWAFGKSTAAESTADAGSNFFINRYSDAGSYTGQPLAITRSTGTVTVGQDQPDATANTLKINGSLALKVNAFSNTGGGRVTNMDGDDYAVIIGGNAVGNVVNLPTASAYTGRVYLVVNHAANDLTITSYVTAFGVTSTTVAAGTRLQVMSDGTSWHKIN
jgi:hypothetical protein